MSVNRLNITVSFASKQKHLLTLDDIDARLSIEKSTFEEATMILSESTEDAVMIRGGEIPKKEIKITFDFDRSEFTTPEKLFVYRYDEKENIWKRLATQIYLSDGQDEAVIHTKTFGEFALMIGQEG